MRILQINTVLNSGSIGRIIEEIGAAVINSGSDSYVAYSRKSRTSRSKTINIGNTFDFYLHVLKTRIFDRHGFGSSAETKKLIKGIEEINPDIIHLHNIHGYYINIEILFNYLRKKRTTLLWTLHDCWPFTGHCSHFERFGCEKWKNLCFECPNKNGYPTSLIVDNSTKNYLDKKKLFSNQNLQIISPSSWLSNLIDHSFLGAYPHRIINNGIDIKTFSPADPEIIRKKYKLESQKIYLGVANTWKKRRALEDFKILSKSLRNDEKIVLIGLDTENPLPDNIIPLRRTENIEDLVAWYSAADLFINPTYADNYPTTNIEALACGTPVVTYNTGGSSEIIDNNTGIVVEKGNIDGLNEAVRIIMGQGKKHYSEKCLNRAATLYDVERMKTNYLSCYTELVNKSGKI